MVPKILDWVEDRTGAVSAVRGFFEEEIPASAGWHQVLGSVALFCFMVQAFTGILLALNYAATPGEAHSSIRYIMTEVTGGAIIRGLHHWGASMMVVVVGLHMAQVVLYGAYKKPREATWLVGLVLLQLVLAFGLTGYLLPWDNRAYWGTVVTTQIAAKAPGAGVHILRLMGAEDGVGSVTFARFYAVHVMLLPLATLGLIGLHVFLVRKHGVMPLAGDNAPKKRFYPGQVFKDTVAIFLAFAILMVLAVAAGAPLGRLADPTDTTYIPRPEWYFLFLFQTLKFFEGPLEIVGSMVLPGLAMTALALLPFFDRGEVVRVTKRTAAIAGLALAAIGWSGLTAAAVLSTPKTHEDDILASAPEAWENLSPVEVAGLGIFVRENCLQCHQVGTRGKAVGPDITRTASRRNGAWLLSFFKNPRAMIPGGSAPPLPLPDAELNSLAAFLLKIKPSTAVQLLETTRPEILRGAMLYQQHRCGACHQVNGVGMKLGPGLNGVGQRRTKDWLERHFFEPAKLVPGSTMPPYRFAPKDLEAITTYLMELPASVSADE